MNPWMPRSKRYTLFRVYNNGQWYIVHYDTVDLALRNFERVAKYPDKIIECWISYKDDTNIVLIDLFNPAHVRYSLASLYVIYLGPKGYGV